MSDSLMDKLKALAKANEVMNADPAFCPIRAAIAEIERLRRLEDACRKMIDLPWQYERDGKKIADDRQAAGKYILENALKWSDRP